MIRNVAVGQQMWFNSTNIYSNLFFSSEEDFLGSQGLKFFDILGKQFLNIVVI